MGRRLTRGRTCLRLARDYRSARSTVSTHLAAYNQTTNSLQGGSDVFIDIGDKSWGVLSCQRYFGGIEGNKSLHVGDQFLSIGANDFKVCFVYCHRSSKADLK